MSRSLAWFVVLLASLCVTQTGPLIAAPIVVDPDAFPSGTVLNNAFPGVTLTALDLPVGSVLPNNQVLSRTSSFTTTGTRAFGNNEPDQPVAWGNGEFDYLRADFAGGAINVTLDFIANDSGGDRNAELLAYNASNNLIDRHFDSFVGFGSPVTLSVSHPSISYVLAYWDKIGRSQNGGLDNLTYTPAALPEPLLSTSPPNGDNLPFGNVRVGTTSNPMGIFINNIGDPGSQIVGSLSTPSGLGPFSSLDGSAIGPLYTTDGPQVKRFQFAPSQRGIPLPKSVEIETNGGNSTISLTGRGVGPVSFFEGVTADRIFDFGYVEVGHQSDPHVFTLTNSTKDPLSTDTDLTITDIKIFGADLHDFQFTGLEKGRVLSKNDFEGISVSFNPSERGQRHAVLQISTDERGPLGVTSHTHSFNLLGTPTQILRVQPIRVLSSSEGEQVPLDVLNEIDNFETFANRIFDQAEIEVEFLPWDTITNDDLLVLDSFDELHDHISSTLHLSDVLQVFFVNDIADCGGSTTALGCATTVGAAIEYGVLAGHQYGVMVHEIGHSLGLPHTFECANTSECLLPADYDPNNLMNPGNAPGNTLLEIDSLLLDLPNIAPNGDMLARLTPEQFLNARDSSYLARAFVAVPEPGSLLICLLGIVALISSRCRYENPCGRPRADLRLLS